MSLRVCAGCLQATSYPDGFAIATKTSRTAYCYPCYNERQNKKVARRLMAKEGVGKCVVTTCYRAARVQGWYCYPCWWEMYRTIAQHKREEKQERDFAICAQYEQGDSLAALALRYGMSKAGVVGALERNGVPRRRRGRPTGGTQELEAENA